MLKLIDLVPSIENPLIEGLIKSMGVGDLIHQIQYWFVSPKKIQVKENTKTGTISIRIKKSLTDNEAKHLLQLINNTGWFPSSYSVFPGEFSPFNEHVFDLRPPVTIVIEAKYDVINRYNGKFVYHLTTKDKLEKIKKIGLAPKTNSKLSKHPDRIYVSKSLEGIERLLPKFKQLYPDTEFVVLKIKNDISKFNNDGIERFVYFDDPNFKEFGMYTHQNISPDRIEVLDET